MSETLVPIAADRAHLPAPSLMRQRMAAGQGLAHNFSDGVLDSFPRISIKGKVFSIRAEGRNEVYKDPVTGHPYAFLDVVFVNASRSLAKTYYSKGFVEGDMNPPDCWSLDSVRPDPSIPRPVSPTCQGCPMNAFGSRVTPDGKGAKACADSRRVALTLPHMLLTMEEPLILMLRIPQASLKNLKAYAEGQLARNGYEPGGCVTRLSFDYTAAFPKLQFQFVGPLSDPEFGVVIEQASGAKVASMLNAPDFDVAASPTQEGMADTQTVQPMQRQAPPVTGFAAGDLSQPIHAQAAPVYAQPAQVYAQPAQVYASEQQAPPVQQQAAPVRQPEQQAQPQLMRLPTGELIDLTTGEIIPEAEPEIDPDVIKISDGRFFHRVKGAFVASQYKDAGPATAVPPTGKAEPAKRAPRKAKAEEPQANGGAPAGTAAQEQPQAEMQMEGQQTIAQAMPNPGVNPAAKTVVAASPRLEELIKSMTPKKAN